MGVSSALRMSQSTEKASRRDLRRAFGPEACEAIAQHDQELTKLTQADQDAIRARLALAASLHARMDEHAALFLKLKESHDGFRTRTWRDRLRWMILGR